MKGSLIIVGFFLLGTLCGMFHLLPSDLSQSNISFYALCALMFSVGISIGNGRQRHLSASSCPTEVQANVWR